MSAAELKIEVLIECAANVLWIINHFTADVRGWDRTDRSLSAFGCNIPELLKRFFPTRPFAVTHLFAFRDVLLNRL